MSENIYRRARIPLFYPLVFLLNVAVVIMLELLLVYTLPIPLTGECLARELPGYENAVIENGVEGSNYYWYLAKTEGGEYHVIPLRRHSLFFDRCQIVDDQITVIPSDVPEMEVKVKVGLTGSTLLIGTQVDADYDDADTAVLNMRPQWFGLSQAGTYALAGYVFWGLLLSFLESFLWNKLKAR